MRRLVFLPLAVIAAAGPPPAAAAESSPAAIVSSYRKANGLPPVSVDPTLTRLAASQSVAMARSASMSHSVAGSFDGRLRESGFRFSGAGENLGFGYRSFGDAMEGWKSSSGHRQNLLIHGATRMGWAKSAGAGGRYYWTLILAAPAPVEPKGGPYLAAASKPAVRERSAKSERRRQEGSLPWPLANVIDFFKKL